jgi:hypothetical protein
VEGDTEVSKLLDGEQWRQNGLANLEEMFQTGFVFLSVAAK